MSLPCGSVGLLLCEANLMVMELLRAGLGLAFFVGVAWLMSSAKGRFPWRVVVAGLALQVGLAVLVLWWGPGAWAVGAVASGVREMLDRAVTPAVSVVFGNVLAEGEEPIGFVFAFAGTGLLGIIFFSALLAVLYHLRVMQVVVWALAWMLSKTLRVSGAESLAMAANVFVGQTEAPLVIRPYLAKLTRSELMTLMVGGFATIAGTVLAVYIGITEKVAPGLGQHFIAASIMSAPAAFLIAKVMVPETEQPATRGLLPLRDLVKQGRGSGNVVEAAAAGTQDGLKLYLNVVAMIIAFLGLVYLVDWPLGALGGWLESVAGWGPGEELSLRFLLGLVFAPVAWLMGVEGWADCQRMGSLMGTKLTLSEFVAFLDLSKMVVGAEGGFASERSARMAVYTLCGFANVASIGIQIGGIAALVPELRRDLSRLAVRAMLAGAMASWMTATVAGVFV
ncbi:MAG: nucleoside transporter C-terminal domain-containing protein [Planctomycetota bacterium]